ncbi:MAG: NAD-dependent epimerase/dehydratase family protein [Pyrinomonadaceae bacterium]
MTNRKIVVTGAHSYLGQKLLKHLLEIGGFDVAAFITPWSKEVDLVTGTGVTYFKVDLREQLVDQAASAVSNAERVLHFAWIRGKDEKSVLNDNLKMFENLRQNITRPEKLIFISSVAASPETLSAYGRTKFKMAQELSKYGAVILVTGLIVDKDPKGPYKLLVNVVKKFPLSVRFTKNSVKVYPIRTDDFLNGIVTILTHPIKGGFYRLYPSNAADINDFLAELEKKHPRTRFPVPMSYKLTLGSLKSMHRVGLLPATLGEKLLTFLYKDEAYLESHDTLPGTGEIDRPIEEMI